MANAWCWLIRNLFFYYCARCFMFLDLMICSFDVEYKWPEEVDICLFLSVMSAFATGTVLHQTQLTIVSHSYFCLFTCFNDSVKCCWTLQILSGFWDSLNNRVSPRGCSVIRVWNGQSSRVFCGSMGSMWFKRWAKTNLFLRTLQGQAPPIVESVSVKGLIEILTMLKDQTGWIEIKAAVRCCLQKNIKCRATIISKG